MIVGVLSALLIILDTLLSKLFGFLDTHSLIFHQPDNFTTVHENSVWFLHWFEQKQQTGQMKMQIHPLQIFSDPWVWDPLR